MKWKFILAFSLLFQISKADYSNWAVELEVTFTNGTTDTLYQESGAAHYDSLKAGIYHLVYYSGMDTVRLLEDRKRVKIKWNGHNYQKLIYGDLVKYLPSEIKSSRLLSFESNSYATNVYFGVSTTDTSILASKPIRLVYAGIELCSYNIFVYKETENVQSVLHKIEAFDKKLEGIVNPSSNDEDEEPEYIEYDIFDFESKYSPELQKILLEFKQGEVVIFETCTC